VSRGAREQRGRGANQGIGKSAGEQVSLNSQSEIQNSQSSVDWAEVEAEETRLLRQMTIAESVAQLVSLYRAFGPLLEQTEPLFRAEREAYLIELQRRLRRLEEWRKEHNQQQ
jgi:hypothetical protein